MTYVKLSKTQIKIIIDALHDYEYPEAIPIINYLSSQFKN
jgi:hypothetical protein